MLRTSTTLLALSSSLLGRSTIAFSPSLPPSALRQVRNFHIRQHTGYHKSNVSNRRYHRTFRRMSTSASEAKKRVLVPIGESSEEIETTCITDTLTRFGAEVVVATVMPGDDLVCKMSRGIKIMADTTILEASKEEWDLIALPGGMPGAQHLRDSEPLISLLQTQQKLQKPYGAVCASPAVVLAHWNLLSDGGGATCYPADGFRSVMPGGAGNDDVVVQGNVVTSQGPGTSLQFALALGELLYGKEKADAIAKEMLVL